MALAEGGLGSTVVGLRAAVAVGLSGDLPVPTLALSDSQHSLFQDLRECPCRAWASLAPRGPCSIVGYW